ncbi:hypothetical protein [Neobacillus fumarioli]|uniref:hypothetical protein n=1 Tax=Neobacillus fumarioli TaxID=105229 RepID=UPI00082FC71D|nr:hypothetical protein [Neobacillus fumarioli]
MGKFIKFIMVIVAAAVLIFIIIGVIRGIPNITNESKPPQQSASTMPSKEDYDKVRIGDPKTGKGGMTLKEVEQFLGNGSLQTTSKSGNSVLEVYTFAGKAGPNSILVTFVNGHASGKSQTGLD